jgi:organic hydroperoxide reductase OsmC/OhrA
MSDIHNYNVNTTWLEGRKGLMESSVLNQKIEVATPPEFTKGIAGIWSPEHLFVAAAGSCFMTTFLAIAEKSRLEFIGFSCSASGILQKTENGMMITSITLHPILQVADYDAVEKGMKVLDTSHRSCLILNSVKSEIIFVPNVHCGEKLHAKVL